MKKIGRSQQVLLSTSTTAYPTIGNVINCENYSRLDTLLRVTAYVLKFTRLLRLARKNRSSAGLTKHDISEATELWIREQQRQIASSKHFKNWQHQLGLYSDNGILCCKGRLGNAALPWASKFPILLKARHHFATLIIWHCHQIVHQGGVKETLTDLRSADWLMLGRYLVRKLLFGCVVCRRVQGRSLKGVAPPPLPEFRVKESPPCQRAWILLDHSMSRVLRKWSNATCAYSHAALAERFIWSSCRTSASPTSSFVSVDLSHVEVCQR